MTTSKVIDIHGADAHLYPMFAGWWVEHNTAATPIGILPKCGILLEENGLPVAVCWLYMDNSVGAAWVAWLTTRPDLKGRDSVHYLNILMGAVEVVAKGMDYGLLFTMAKSKGLKRWFERFGFTANHSGMTQLFKGLN